MSGKIMIKKILIVIVSILLLTNCVQAVNINLSEKTFFNSSITNWTVMYYMCGDNDAMDSYIAPLLENLSNIGSNKNLNIISLSDRTGSGNSKIYYFNETGEKIELNQIYGWPSEINTNNLNTLELYCKQIINSYPAKNYALIIYTAGGNGWQTIYLGDEDDKNNVVTYPELAQSLETITSSVGKKIDVFVGSCSINMMEVGYELAPYVDYIVGTQDCFPLNHVVPMFYKAVYDLKNNTDLTPEEFAVRSPANYKAVTFHYIEGYGGKISVLFKIFDRLPCNELHSVYHHSSIGVINNSELSKLSKDFNDLISLLILNIHDTEIFSSIKKTRNEVQELAKCAPIFPSLYNFYRKFPFEFLAYDCYVDMYDLIHLFKENIDNDVIKNRCDIVLNQINKTIPMVSKVENIPSCGMNIYFPKNSFLYNKYKSRGKIPCPYEELKFTKDTEWDEFLKAYLYI